MKIGINGFGRIGRTAMRIAAERGIEVAMINDLTSVDMLAHLLKYDSVHGTWDKTVTAEGKALLIGGKKVQITSERDPGTLPWKDFGVDVVLECTGLFTDREKAAAHLKGGAKKVIISAPSKDADATFAIGINTDTYDAAKHTVISCASCTTNALAPVAKVLDETFGIEKGLMTTIHSYTNDQNILDLPNKDWRRARAAALNMIPTSTGAAKAIGLVLPKLKGKLDGTAIRVPTPNVSLVDLTVTTGKATTKDEVNAAMKKAADGALKGVLEYCDKPLVSHDFNGNSHSSIFDADCTIVTGGNLVKVFAWYDNETGYSTRLIELASLIGKKL
ncbi:MAG: type I glyceraldehyde-3-phosphate dehydrogenase [Bdellovibrionota bacterium]